MLCHVPSRRFTAVSFAFDLDPFWQRQQTFSNSFSLPLLAIPFEHDDSDPVVLIVHEPERVAIESEGCRHLRKALLKDDPLSINKLFDKEFVFRLRSSDAWDFAQHSRIHV